MQRSWPTSSTSSVAILIVDDFGGEEGTNSLQQAFTIGKDFDSGVLDKQDANNQLLALDDQPGLHGPLVMNHLNQLIQSTGKFMEPMVSSDNVLWQLDGSQSYLLVQAVNVPGYDPDLVQSATAAAIDNLMSEGYERFVINMSFGAIPCSVAVDFDQSSFGEARLFEAYVDAERQVNGLSDLYQEPERETIQSILCENPVDERTANSCADNDTETLLNGYVNSELYCFLTTPVPGSNAIETLVSDMRANEDIAVEFVASSGNFSRPCPLYPARLADVISISSNNVNSSDLSGFTNLGEIVGPGSWFWLANSLDIYTLDTNDPMAPGPRSVRVGYAGTSFSSPYISLRVASRMSINLWDQNDHNAHAYAGQATPPLRYYCNLEFSLTAPVCP